MRSPEDEDRLGPAVGRLLAIMERLRDPAGGCPWDREQRWDTIVPHTIEEAYEVADAIAREAWAELPGELGDLLFQVVYYAQFAREEGRFSFLDVLETLAEKLVRRHPHVFGEVEDASMDAIKHRWEAAKAAERAARVDDQPVSELDDVPVTLPAITRAHKLQKRAARVGFDFPTVEAAFAKLESEVVELAEALAQSDRDAIAHEIGDVIFATVNLSRRHGLDAESCVRGVNERFERRFRAVEAGLRARAMAFADADEALLDELWEAAKRQEREG